MSNNRILFSDKLSQKVLTTVFHVIGSQKMRTDIKPDHKDKYSLVFNDTHFYQIIWQI